MKVKLLGIFLLLAGLVFGGEIEREINELLKEVKSAPPEERYKVMNELKLKLRELNRREREEAIRRIYRELKGEEHYEREHGHEEFEEEQERGFSHEMKEEERGERYEEKVEEKYENRVENKMGGRENGEHD